MNILDKYFEDMFRLNEIPHLRSTANTILYKSTVHM